MNEVERVREAYRPSRVRILFVGESAPVSGDFFYFGNTGLARYTQQAFERALDTSFDSEAQFLAYFRNLGCWLDDLSRMPVNHLKRKERRQQLVDSVDDFTERLREASPDYVVVVLKSISKFIDSAISASGLRPQVFYLPFAGVGHQNKYMDQLVKVLQRIAPLS